MYPNKEINFNRNASYIKLPTYKAKVHVQWSDIIKSIKKGVTTAALRALIVSETTT
jgi:hypothetical protein